MSLIVCPHAGLGGLVDQLLGELTPDPSAYPLRPLPLVTPSVQFRDWLQVAIARRRGICMGLEFLMAGDLISRVARLAPAPSQSVWSKDELLWRILPRVDRFAGFLGIEDPTPRDRLAVATLLADQLDQYGHYRPEWIAKWQAGKSVLRGAPSAAERATEHWQRDLWRELDSELSALGAEHPAQQSARLYEDTAFRQKLARAFPKIFIVGTGTLDPLLVRVLRLLSDAGCGVRVDVVLPSLGYLGHLRHRTRLIEQDVDAIEMPAGHPLLESMGRHAVGSFLLLGELDENYAHWPDEDPESETGGTLLGTLQADIRNLRAPSPAVSDKSLRVHSCFGPRREMEVLRDEIFRAFRDLPDLRPEEIVILAPSLELYAPLAAGILEQGGQLPIRLTQIPAAEQNPAATALLALLDLAGTAFETSRLMELLQLDAVCQRLGVEPGSEEQERLRDLLRQSGQTRGLDGPETPGTWSCSRDRVISGRWFGGEDEAAYPDSDFALPVADELGGHDGLRARFVEWHAAVARTMAAWQTEAVPAIWGDRLSLACDELLGPADDADFRMGVQSTLGFLTGLACGEKIDAGALKDWLENEWSEALRRSPVSGRITFGTFKQMQNIPCRVLAFVGMNEGTFPRQNRSPAWDLLRCDPRPWDRNPRVDDRQLFLDALLTPSDRLIITAPNRNVRTGKSEPFSLCVDELLRVAGAMTGGHLPVIEHPLQPFSADYFPSPGGAASLPPSFDAAAAGVCASLRCGAENASGMPFWSPDSSAADAPPDGGMITVSQLVEFWKNPARSFLREESIFLLRRDEDPEALDRSPLTLEGLGLWSAKNALLNSIVSGTPSPGCTKARLAADRVLPPGALGEQRWTLVAKVAIPVGEAARKLSGDGLPVDLTCDGIRLTGRLPRTSDGRGLLSYRAGKFSDASDVITPWIHAVIAAAAGTPLETFLIDDESGGQPRIREAIDQEAAGRHLASLLRGFLAGRTRPLCFAPAASSAIAKALNGDEQDTPAAVAAGRADWEEKSSHATGEGHEAAAALAWRDLDPFAFSDEWLRWAREIALPLENWRTL